MTVEEIKRTVDRTGNAYLLLFNDYDEHAAVGNVYNLTHHKNQLRFQWKLPNVNHVSPFTKAAIYTKPGSVIWTEEISPVRLDQKTKKFEVSLDYAG